MTARDRKIISIIVPVLLVAGYWFLVLAPKRVESQRVTQELSKAVSARDQAEAQVAQLQAAKASFASDYATVLRLGKAVPTTVDMPSLLVQIDAAARGTGVQIGDFKPGTASGATTAPSGTANTPPGGGSNPAAPGAPPAQGFPAKQAQHAGNAVTQANNQNQANANAANATPGAPSAGTPSVPGLVSIPLNFTMTGSFFNLADFFHRMKRFVQVVNNQIVVKGRLMTIETFTFQSDAQNTTTSNLKADVTATIYLSPADQGATAGATSNGPAGATGSPAPSSPSQSGPSPTPTATATP